MNTGNGYSKLVAWQMNKVGDAGSKVFVDRQLTAKSFIYHMLPWKFARMILDDRRIRLSPLRQWDDPYERWSCNLLFGPHRPLCGLEAYGLCFTTGAHDEPRWRMAAYKRGRQPIVRLRSSIAQLSRVATSLSRGRSGASFVGSVRYQPQSWIIEHARTIPSARAKPVTRSAGEMLLHKRKAFSFESEVRLLWLDRASPSEAIFVNVEPIEVFDQLMVSPYAGVRSREKIEAFCADIGLPTQPSSVGNLPEV